MWISFKLLHKWEYYWRKEITYRGLKRLKDDEKHITQTWQTHMRLVLDLAQLIFIKTWAWETWYFIVLVSPDLRLNFDLCSVLETSQDISELNFSQVTVSDTWNRLKTYKCLQKAKLPWTMSVCDCTSHPTGSRISLNVPAPWTLIFFTFQRFCIDTAQHNGVSKNKIRLKWSWKLYSHITDIMSELHWILCMLSVSNNAESLPCQCPNKPWPKLTLQAYLGMVWNDHNSQTKQVLGIKYARAQWTVLTFTWLHWQVQ